MAMLHETWMKKTRSLSFGICHSHAHLGPSVKRAVDRCFPWARSLVKHFTAISSLASLQKREAEWETEVLRTFRKKLCGRGGA